MDEIKQWEMNLTIENISQAVIDEIFTKLVADINEAGGMVGGGYYEYNDEGGGDE